MPDRAPRKVFVTGVYGSGKTRFAKRYARAERIPYVSFDALHAYAVPERQSDRILAGLPAEFVIDAIPFDEDLSWGRFTAYERENAVQVVCVYCADRDAWLRRVQEKTRIGTGRPERLRDGLRRWIDRVRRRHPAPDPVDAALHLRKYRGFFNQNVPRLSRFRHVRCYDSGCGEYTGFEEMLERIRFRNFRLEDRLDALGKDHDKAYQDIEILGFVGYTESYRTWERIAGLVRWDGRTVVDLGCFHGYFCFKAEDAGGIPIGLDRSAAALDVARLINEARGGRAEFRQWAAGAELPEADVVLCLNVLHHFGDRDRSLSAIRAKEAVFEINRGDREAVARHFDILQETDSHRDGRIILHCAPRTGPGRDGRPR